MGGPSTVNMLLGAVGPGAKLPITFPADAFHHPLAVVEQDAAPAVTFIWVPALGPRR